MPNVRSGPNSFEPFADQPRGQRKAEAQVDGGVRRGIGQEVRVELAARLGRLDERASGIRLGEVGLSIDDVPHDLPQDRVDESALPFAAGLADRVHRLIDDGVDRRRGTEGDFVDRDSQDAQTAGRRCGQWAGRRTWRSRRRSRRGCGSCRGRGPSHAVAPGSVEQRGRASARRSRGPGRTRAEPGLRLPVRIWRS